MMDEFTQFGRLTFFEKSLAYSAGYGIRAYLICQDLTQLYEAYGSHQSILSNCNIRVAYTPNNFETAKHLSNLIGCTTMVVSNSSYSGKRFGMYLQNVHKTDYDVKRALITPYELMRMPSDSAIIMKTGLAPILGSKMTYYIDITMFSRSELPFIKEDYKKVKNKWSLHHHNTNHTIKINHDTTSDFAETDILI